MEKRLGALKPLAPRTRSFPSSPPPDLPSGLETSSDPVRLAEVAFSWGIPAWADCDEFSFSGIPTGIVNIAETSEFSRLADWCRENHFDLCSVSSGEFGTAHSNGLRIALDFGPNARRFAYDPIKNTIIAELGVSLGTLRRSLARHGKAIVIADALPDHLTVLDCLNLAGSPEHSWQGHDGADEGICEIPVHAVADHSMEITAFLPDYPVAIEWARQLTQLPGIEVDCMAHCPDDAAFLGIGNGEHAVLSLKIDGAEQDCRDIAENIRAQMFATNGGPLPFIQALPDTGNRGRHLARLPSYRTCLARLGVVSNQHPAHVPWSGLSAAVTRQTTQIATLNKTMRERIFVSQRLLGGTGSHAMLQTSFHIRSTPCRAIADWQFVRETLDQASAG